MFGRVGALLEFVFVSVTDHIAGGSCPIVFGYGRLSTGARTDEGRRTADTTDGEWSK